MHCLQTWSWTNLPISISVPLIRAASVHFVKNPLQLNFRAGIMRSTPFDPGLPLLAITSSIVGNPSVQLCDCPMTGKDILLKAPPFIVQ